jgi:tetratricopeptide (TPR) repeat protein
VLAMRGEQPGAIADLDKAVELAPNAAIPLVLRARIHQQAGNTEKAEADLEIVLKQDPDNAPALELRGLIAADRADYVTAIRDFRRLVATNPEDPIVVSQLALLYLAAKQPREAIRRFTRAIELDDTNFLSIRGRSDAEISIGDHQAALADLERALTLKPDDSGVLNNLAWLLATSPVDEIRNGERAIELAEKACEETEWQEAHIISTLAAGYAETGNFETAREYSQKAVETGGEAEEIVEQLEKELESYKAEKPWRERQEMEEAVLEGGESDDAVEALITDDAADMPQDAPTESDAKAAPPKPRRPF